MSTQQKLFELFARDPLYAHTVELLVRGQNDIVRFPPIEFFTVPFEGDELVLTDTHRSEIEAALGEPLVEGPAIGGLGKHAIIRLCAPIALKVEIDSALREYRSETDSATS